MKCQIVSIFLIAEIHKIDPEAIFVRILKIPTEKFRFLGTNSVSVIHNHVNAQHK